MNFPLLSMLWAMAATVIVGILMIAALVTGFDSIPNIITTVVLGGLVAIPTAYLLTKKIGGIGIE